MDLLEEILTSESYGMIAITACVVLVLWFLPAIIALFLNRKHFKLILVACIPAGLSFIAWGGLLIWATTGKVVDKWSKKSTSDRKA